MAVLLDHAEAVKPKLGVKVGDLYDAIGWQDNYHDLYPGYSDDSGEENTYFKSKEAAEQWAQDIYDWFETLHQKPRLRLYRTVGLKKGPESFDRESMGESWSYERAAALSFGGHTGARSDIYLVSAETDRDNINWKESMVRYIQFSQSMSADDEHELVVRDDSEPAVKVLSIEKAFK